MFTSIKADMQPEVPTPWCLLAPTHRNCHIKGFDTAVIARALTSSDVHLHLYCCGSFDQALTPSDVFNRNQIRLHSIPTAPALR